jgi:D-alanyl-D-alanine carboxypeptidase
MNQVTHRGPAPLSWFASCLLVAALILPFTADAQSVSSKMRAPSRAHAKAIKTTPKWIPHPSISERDSYLIVDAGSGRELAEDRAEELRHPASLAKLMTIYMAFSYLDSGKLDLGDLMPVSANAVNVSPTKMGVPYGGTVTVRDAVMGLVTRSANDAAVVLAEAMGGDEASFARMMTQKARQLGMSQTVFRNASGLPDREQVTTAHDMARLAHALLRDFPHYHGIFSTQTYYYRGRPMENHNRLLASYRGADGFKTGYTNASGFNLVMSAQRDGRRLIGVVMGGRSAISRDRLMAELMDRSFDRADNLNLAANWRHSPTPATARYSAAHFNHNAVIPDAPVRVAAPAPRTIAQIAKAEAPPAPAPATSAPTIATLASASPTAVPLPAPPASAPAVSAPVVSASVASAPTAFGVDAVAPSIGTWVIQIGSFSDSNSAIKALERASSILPNLRGKSAAAVDEVQLAQKTFHRARLTNLSQEDATDGCKKLEAKKIFCSALQVTAWNTPGAR